MARLTEYQKLTLHCLEDIVELYRRVEEGKETFSSTVNEIKQRLLDRIAVSYGYEKGSYSVFSFARHRLSLDYDKGRIACGPDEASTFIGIMKALREALPKNEFHFLMMALFDRTDAGLTDGTGIINPFVKFPNRDKKSDTTLYSRKLTKEMRYALRTVPPIPITTRIFQRLKYPPYIHSFRYGWMTVWTHTKFGNFLLHAKPMEPQMIDIPKLTPRHWGSFTQIVRAILVNFHHAFGGYCRIKLCKTCRTLVVSHRKDTKSFCSDKCRSKFSDEPERRLGCRKNQNQWIRYRIKLIEKDHLLTAYGLNKDECGKCNLWHRTGKPLKGGKCPILRTHNEDAFEMIDKQMEEKMKRRETKKNRIIKSPNGSKD